MYGDYASIERLVALGADLAKLKEYCSGNNTGYVMMLETTLFETAVIIPWLLENQESFTAMNLLGWK